MSSSSPKLISLKSSVGLRSESDFCPPPPPLPPPPLPPPPLPPPPLPPPPLPPPPLPTPPLPPPPLPPPPLPPPPLPSAPPLMNTTWLATISTLLLREPSSASHRRWFKRPSMATSRPLLRYRAQFSP